LRQVKRNLITRESVEKYVDKRMKDDKDEKRLNSRGWSCRSSGCCRQATICTPSFCACGRTGRAYYDPRRRA